MHDEPPLVADLENFLAERGERLLRTAILLTGSRESGEDLLQSALERLFRRWRVIRGDPESYLRQTMVRLATDRWRRQGRWRVRLGLLHADSTGYQPDGTSHIDDRDELLRLLRRLPARQRTVIVLRYWDDLSEAEVATVMRCSVGTVKSTASRGMRRLRELSGTGYAVTGRQQ